MTKEYELATDNKVDLKLEYESVGIYDSKRGGTA